MPTALGDCRVCLKPRPAVTVERLSFGDSAYKLAVCDEHADGFRRDMYRWSRCGILDEGDECRAFKPKARPPARNLGRLVVSKLQIPAVTAPEPEPEPELPAPRPQPRFDTRMPVNADRWTWTSHAVGRATLRQLTEDEVLWCAEHPDVTRAGRKPGTRIHQRGHVKVVIDPEMHEILTVADTRFEDNDMEMELQDAS